MKKQEKEIVIKEQKFISEDGKEFDNEQDCINHEKRELFYKFQLDKSKLKKYSKENHKHFAFYFCNEILTTYDLRVDNYFFFQENEEKSKSNMISFILQYFLNQRNYTTGKRTMVSIFNNAIMHRADFDSYYQQYEFDRNFNQNFSAEKNDSKHRRHNSMYSIQNKNNSEESTEDMFNDLLLTEGFLDDNFIKNIQKNEFIKERGFDLKEVYHLVSNTVTNLIYGASYERDLKEKLYYFTEKKWFKNENLIQDINAKKKFRCGDFYRDFYSCMLLSLEKEDKEQEYYFEQTFKWMDVYLKLDVPINFFKEDNHYFVLEKNYSLENRKLNLNKNNSDTKGYKFLLSVDDLIKDLEECDYLSAETKKKRKEIFLNNIGEKTKELNTKSVLNGEFKEIIEFGQNSLLKTYNKIKTFENELGSLQIDNEMPSISIMYQSKKNNDFYRSVYFFTKERNDYFKGIKANLIYLVEYYKYTSEKDNVKYIIQEKVIFLKDFINEKNGKEQLMNEMLKFLTNGTPMDKDKIAASKNLRNEIEKLTEQLKELQTWN